MTNPDLLTELYDKLISSSVIASILIAISNSCVINLGIVPGFLYALLNNRFKKWNSAQMENSTFQWNVLGGIFDI
jgi:uncharacterized membrane protein